MNVHAMMVREYHRFREQAELRAGRRFLDEADRVLAALDEQLSIEQYVGQWREAWERNPDFWKE